MAQKELDAFNRCLQRYPGVQLSSEDFQSHIDATLAKWVPSSGGPSYGAACQIHQEDLFLALACSRNDRVAWEHFADEYLPMLRRFATRACGRDSDGEDLAQDIFRKVLTEPGRLAGYNGRGSLAGWLRVIVSHAAIDRFRRIRRQVALDDWEEKGDAAAMSIPAASADADPDDSRWGAIISNIAGETIAGLSPRDRLILGFHYLNGVSLKEIGRQFAIHEATVSRWIERLRIDIRNRVERQLRKKHGLRASEIQSLWKKISIASVVSPIAGAMPESFAEKVAAVDSAAAKKAARRAD